jgi:prevent-host-death family protein
MVKPMRITEARNKLTSLPRVLKHDDTVAVTRRGKNILALMSWELYEALVETLEIMGDPKLLAQLRKSIKEAESGKLIAFEEVEKELG